MESIAFGGDWWSCVHPFSRTHPSSVTFRWLQQKTEGVLASFPRRNVFLTLICRLATDHRATALHPWWQWWSQGPFFCCFFLFLFLNFAFYHIQTISRCGWKLQRKNPFLRQRPAPYSCGQCRHHPQTRSDVGIEINGLEFTNHVSAPPPPQHMCALGTCPRRDEASLKGWGASSAGWTSAPSSQRCSHMQITINLIGFRFVPVLFERSPLKTVLIFVHLDSVTLALHTC